MSVPALVTQLCKYADMKNRDASSCFLNICAAPTSSDKLSYRHRLMNITTFCAAAWHAPLCSERLGSSYKVATGGSMSVLGHFKIRGGVKSFECVVERSPDSVVV